MAERRLFSSPAMFARQTALLLRQARAAQTLRRQMTISNQIPRMVMRSRIANFHTTRLARIQLSSALKQSATHDQGKPADPAKITDEEYHELADDYLENVCNKLEDMQEQRGEIEVEFSAGVMNVVVPGVGTYVLNKQPPNKQIWLSSPVSGPKRYDWVLPGGSQQQKEGQDEGDWIYLRDGSSLTDLLITEIGVEM